MTERALRETRPGKRMNYYDWILRELILHPERFYTWADAKASMAKHRAEREQAKQPKAGR